MEPLITFNKYSGSQSDIKLTIAQKYSFIDFRGMERQSLFVRLGALLSDKPMPKTVQTLQRGVKNLFQDF